MNTFKTWHVGRKEIIAYLQPFLKLPQNPAYAWQKVKRWRRRGFPIEILPNGKPFIDESVNVLFWIKFRERMNKRDDQDTKK
jgi:hypothetical protein